VRPAVSVGRTTALDDGFDPNEFGLFSNLGNDNIHDDGYSSFFGAADPTGADNRFFENGIQSLTHNFDPNYNNMASHNDNVLADFNINDFLYPDAELAPEIQSSDSLAEKTANLQPQFGASSLGCDDGGNAVSV